MRLEAKEEDSGTSRPYPSTEKATWRKFLLSFCVTVNEIFGELGVRSFRCLCAGLKRPCCISAFKKSTNGYHIKNQVQLIYNTHGRPHAADQCRQRSLHISRTAGASMRSFKEDLRWLQDRQRQQLEELGTERLGGDHR